jgi:hypothetical protein
MTHTSLPPAKASPSAPRCFEKTAFASPPGASETESTSRPSGTSGDASWGSSANKLPPPTTTSLGRWSFARDSGGVLFCTSVAALAMPMGVTGAAEGAGGPELEASWQAAGEWRPGRTRGRRNASEAWRQRLSRKSGGRGARGVALTSPKGAGRTLARYRTALGSARETGACLDVAVALGYVETVDPVLVGKISEVQAMLVALVR